MPILNENDLKALILSRHPTYNGPEWMFHWGAYTGGSAFANKLNIFKHKKESSDIYNDRVRRAYYYNYVKRLTRLAVDFIFQSGDIGREASDENALDNVDRKGTDVDDFMSELAIRGITQGVSYAAVDAPARDPQSIRSRADEMAGNVGPYWYRINREDMLNWDLDRFGKPEWVFLRETPPAGMSIMDSLGRADKSYYLIWTREAWQRIAVEFRGVGQYRTINKIEQMEEGPNEIGEVTVVPFYGDQQGDWEGDSWNEDISYIARNLLNVCSLRDDYNFQCAFEMYVFPGSEPSDLEDIALGSHEVISTPAEATQLPFSLSHSGNAASILAQQIADHVSEMHRLTAQRLMNISALSDGASGVSKMEDFRATNTTLSNLADECERVENRLHEFSALYSGAGEDAAITADYPDDFDTSALERQLDILEQVDTLGFPDEVIGFLQERVVRQMAQPGKDGERLAEMLDAIKAKFERGDDEPVTAPPAPIEQITPTGAVNPGTTVMEADNG